MSPATQTADCQVCQVQGRRWGWEVAWGCPGPRGSFSEIPTLGSAPGLACIQAPQGPCCLQGRQRTGAQGLDQESEGFIWWALCLPPRSGPWRPHSRVPSRSVELGGWRQGSRGLERTAHLLGSGVRPLPSRSLTSWGPHAVAVAIEIRNLGFHAHPLKAGAGRMAGR